MPFGQNPTSSSQAAIRPTDLLLNAQANASSQASGQSVATIGGSKKRRNHRAGKKKKNRRQSFLPSAEDEDHTSQLDRPAEPPTSAVARDQFYRLAPPGGGNLSETSLASEALLDHRFVAPLPTTPLTSNLNSEHQPMRARRDSKAALSPFPRWSNHDIPRVQRQTSHDHREHRRDSVHGPDAAEDASDEDRQASDRTPLLRASHTEGGSPSHRSGYGLFGRQARNSRRDSAHRNYSVGSSRSSANRATQNQQPSSPALQTIHDVNNPPSIPNSPKLGLGMGYDDVMVTESFTSRSPGERRGIPHDQIISIDNEEGQMYPHSSPPTPPPLSADQRRHTISVPAEDDVCFPVEGLSTLGEEDYLNHAPDMHTPHEPRKRRFRRWPDLSVLDDWSREEKEERSEGIRAKKISEPVLVGGRLRPQQRGWQRTEEDAPYRFTYFNEDIPSTIHSQTISELLQPGQCFQELFIPDPPELSDDDYSSTGEEDDLSRQSKSNNIPMNANGNSRVATRHSSLTGNMRPQSLERSGNATPAPWAPPEQAEKPKRFGERPTFWLDVLSPTDTEMRVISKTFGIHPLTAEDIMMQEAREKVELFPKYYFVNYRTFEQDPDSDDHLEPVNMYVVVFPEGVISFHFSMSPHPANVRRRIRQLKEYLQVTSDWISYALIDDITDVFAPLIQNIEDEVDDIDDAILKLLYDKKEESMTEKLKIQRDSDVKSEIGEPSTGGGDMLRRVGEARKKVMMLYRLLGNKADVIKGFAKRCNEKWQIAPRSDIGLYLGDIQDHIVTMTSNLGHYET